MEQNIVDTFCAVKILVLNEIYAITSQYLDCKF